MLRVFNATARYVDQGGNKRPGAFAIYIEPWHADIYDFLDLRKNTGKEEQVRRPFVTYNLRSGARILQYKKIFPCLDASRDLATVLKR